MHTHDHTTHVRGATAEVDLEEELEQSGHVVRVVVKEGGRHGGLVAQSWRWRRRRRRRTHTRDQNKNEIKTKI
jgi:hypothetical protein